MAEPALQRRADLSVAEEIVQSGGIGRAGTPEGSGPAHQPVCLEELPQVAGLVLEPAEVDVYRAPAAPRAARDALEVRLEERIVEIGLADAELEAAAPYRRAGADLLEGQVDAFVIESRERALETERADEGFDVGQPDTGVVQQPAIWTVRAGVNAPFQDVEKGSVTPGQLLPNALPRGLETAAG